MSLFNTSVIIPAHNAAETLSKTLESLSKQTIPNWEAIVVDDGSMDDTAAIATQFATQDKRIRVISQPQSGVSAARNQGIELAQFDWLLFLDADDWIAPHHLERMAEKLTANPELDGVYCGWVRITPDGHTLQESYCPKAEALFPTLTRTCAFAIHACIVRKSLVQTAGGFDPCLRTCEDWDLWQRLARSGAQFGSIREAMAYYRMRPNSVSINGSKLLADAIKVINRGHQPDPRVTHPHSTYANGQPNEQRSEAILQWSCWAAGLMIGADQDACELMSLIGQLSAPSLDPSQVAYSIFYAAVLPTCQSLSGWSKLWPQSESKVQAFLSALEIQSQTIGLAQRSQRSLERLVLSHWKPSTPVMVGATYALRIEVSEPFADIHPPETAERLYAMIELEGDFLGTIELPVCDGIVLASVLADAIAAHYSWPILGRFFVNTVYPQWCQPGQETEIESWHDSIGWITLLRELWNRPDFTEAQFYDPTFAEYSDTPPQPISAPDDHLTVEVSSDLPTVNVETAALNVLATVGGAVLGIISVPAVNRIVTAQAIRAAIITAGGLELCRLCVREALLGRSFHDPMPIRERLAIATQAKLNSLNSTASSVTPSDTTTVFGRRSGPIGSSISRQAAFPVAAQDAIVTMAEIAGEPSQLASSTTPSRLIYQPDWVHAAAPTQSLKNVSLTQSSDTHRPGRDHFETLFAVSPDPWKYTSPYEQTKYEQTLSLLPGGRIRNALEIACAEGHFTVQLAPHVDRLLVADISQIALDRTAERCSNFNHIQFQQLDLVKDTLPGTFDLIICSEVLYYMGDRTDLEAIAQKMAEALVPGGHLLMAHAHVVVDEPDRAGFDWDVPFGAKTIGDTFASLPSLRLAKEIWTPLYRIQLFQRKPTKTLWWSNPKPQITKLSQQPAPLPPEVAAHALWQGGKPAQYVSPEPIRTDRLPILMYHRVAPTGVSELNRWRITPEAFEDQLRYLRDAGYYSVSVDTWCHAMLNKTALPGRAILLTFDDGFLDFFTYAQPLLKQYGFSALVFLVADQVGRSNGWDTAYGEELPLMNWDHIRQLQAEGIQFGSHSATHRPLTSLSVADMVQEGARSRTILQQELGTSIHAFAYPYGDFDPVVEHLIGACGYTSGFSCRSGHSKLQDSLLALPRIEVMGSDNLQEFVKKLSIA